MNYKITEFGEVKEWRGRSYSEGREATEFEIEQNQEIDRLELENIQLKCRIKDVLYNIKNKVEFTEEDVKYMKVLLD